MNFNYDLGTIDTILTLDTTETPALGGQTNVLVVLGTGAITLPSGTTAQQPGTPTAGMIRWNSQLTQLEYYNGSTWPSFSTAGTVTSVTATGSTGLTVGGSPVTSSGTLTFTLSTSLQALSTLGGGGSTGLIVQTGVGTFADVTITGTSNDITVTNGSGVAGNPTIDLATVTQGAGSSFVKITLDTKGRVSGNTAVAQSDLTGLLGTYYIPSTGGTVGGSLTFTSGTVTGLATPSAASDAVTLSYVQNLVNGLEWKLEAAAATTANLTATYSNGASGVGATLTSTTNVAFTTDGYSAVLNDRILVKNQTTTFQNGIYTVTTVGSGATPWVLTRSADANTSTELNNATLYVTNGTTNAATSWNQTTATPTIGTSAVVFVQSSGAGASVTSFSGGTTGLTPSTATTGAVTLAGTLVAGSGGTGTATAPTAGQLLVGQTGGTYVPFTVTTGTGISTTTGSGTFQINNTGVTALAGTTNQITASASTGSITLSIPSTLVAPGSITATTSLTVSGLTANSFLYSGTAGLLTTTTAPTNGQILIGSTGAAPVAAVIATSGSGISVTNAAGSITLANTGVTSNVAGTGISVSGATGAVTITNTGVTSAVATANQTTVSGATGAVTFGLSSTLVAPGSLQVTTSFQTSATNTISAAGTTQGTATALTTDYNVVTTTASGTGVVLPAGLAGRRITVVNRGANALLLYPASGGTIDGLAANTAVTVPVNGTYELDAISSTQWYTIISSGTSAVTSIAGTTNQITASASTGAVTLSLPSTVIAPGSIASTSTITAATGLTLTYATANSFMYSGTASAVVTTTAPTNGQLLIGSTGAAPVVSGLTGTANQITVTNGAGSITLSLPLAVTITTSLTVSGLTANSFVYSGTAGLLTATTAPTNGQILIGSTGAAPVAATIATSGSGISVTNAAGSITLANTGVTSFSAGTTGFTPSTGTTGAVTLAGTLSLTNGGTNASLTTTAGGVVYSGASALAISTAGTAGFVLQSGGTGTPTWVNPASGLLKLYTESSSSPTAPTATGTNSVAIGNASSATAINSTAIGSGTNSRIWGGVATANGDFATAGDAQQGTYTVRAITTTNTANVELFLDGAGASQRMVLPTNSAWTFDALVTCRRTDATGSIASFRIVGAISKDTTAASTTLIGTVSVTTIGRSTGFTPTCTAVADTTNGSLKVQVTGVTGDTLRWVAVVNTCEVTN